MCTFLCFKKDYLILNFKPLVNLLTKYFYIEILYMNVGNYIKFKNLKIRFGTYAIWFVFKKPTEQRNVLLSTEILPTNK